MGGDEFVVLLDGGELRATPSLVAERLLDVMRQPFELAETGTPLIVHTSIGIAAGDRDTPGEMLRDADVALYQAKAAGKNRYQTFEPAMHTEIRRRVGLGKDLGLRTLAEGVETLSQLNHLRGGQVNEIQGFLLSKPLDPQTLEAQILPPTRPEAPAATHP
jgi:predicted signal transduction protein with EAL and GGDEF domain